MQIKVDCKLLSEQIQLLDAYASVMNNEYNKGLVEGISNFLSQISFAIEKDIEIEFIKSEE